LLLGSFLLSGREGVGRAGVLPVRVLEHVERLQKSQKIIAGFKVCYLNSKPGQDFEY
jgi:hypothetical protein